MATTSRSSHRPFRAAGWRGWVRDDGRSLVARDPLDCVRGLPHEIINDRPSAMTLRVLMDGTPLYVKHFTGFKDRAVGAGDALATLKWLLCSRALHTLRVSGQMEQAGLAVPPVVLAARRRCGAGGAEDLLVSAAVDGTSMQQRIATAATAGELAKLLDLMGRGVAELHRRRFTHGDLLPGNLLVTTGEAAIIWLDNDRTRRWPLRIPAHARRRNLRQALYRLIHWAGYRATRRFLAAYYDALGWSAAARRREIAKLLRNVRRRAAVKEKRR